MSYLTQCDVTPMFPDLIQNLNKIKQHEMLMIIKPGKVGMLFPKQTWAACFSSVSHTQGVFYFPLLEVRWMLLSFLFAWWYLHSGSLAKKIMVCLSQLTLRPAVVRDMEMFSSWNPGLKKVGRGRRCWCYSYFRTRSRLSSPNCFKGTGDFTQTIFGII